MAVVANEMPRKTGVSPDLGVSKVRSIKHTLAIGGIAVEGLVSWSKDELAYSAGSTAQISLRGPVADQQEWMSVSQTVTHVPVVLSTLLSWNGVPYCEATEDFSGILDNIEYVPETKLYTLHVSSYARILVNAKITETIAGATGTNTWTTGKLVEYLVGKYGDGLKVHVDPDLKQTTVGKIYGNQQVMLLRNIPVWDVMQSLAQSDNADLFVKGDTLFYVRKATDTSKNLTQLKGVPADYTFTYGVNILALHVAHAPLFAHDVNVLVSTHADATNQSYASSANLSKLKTNAFAAALESGNKKQLDALDAQNTASTNKFNVQRKPHARAVQAQVHTTKIGTKENYTFVIPNITQDDCERIGLKIMEDIARAEFLVTLTVLAQPDFNHLQCVGIANAPAIAVNQTYAIKSIRTQSGPDTGYVTEFLLVNHAVQTVGVSMGTRPG